MTRSGKASGRMHQPWSNNCSIRGERGVEGLAVMIASPASRRHRRLIMNPGLSEPVERVRADLDFERDEQRAFMPLWRAQWPRSEEHTSELQSLMLISYAVFCL